jgi:hypothetical protein
MSSKIEYVLIAACSLVAGVIVGERLSAYFTQPAIAYEVKVSDDSRQFLDVELRNGKIIPLVRGADNLYKRLDDVQSAETKAIMQKVIENK